MALMHRKPTAYLADEEQLLVLLGVSIAVALSAAFAAHTVMIKGAQFWRVCLRSSKPEDPAIQQLLRRKTSEQKQENMLSVNFIIGVAGVFHGMVSIMLMVTGAARWMTFEQDILFVVGCFVWVACHQCLRRFPSSAVVNSVYVVMAVLLTANAFAGSVHQAPFIVMASYSAFIRLLWSLACLNPSLAACTNCLDFISMAFAFSQTQQPCEQESYLTTRHFGLMMFVCDGSIVLGAVVWHRISASRTLHEIQAAISQGENTAAKSLLNTVCDATVVLDAELRVADDAPRFASWLQHGPNRSLHGTPVTQYVHPEDVSLFQDRINTFRDSDSNGIANVFHMRIRDCIGNAFSVEVFHVPISNCLTLTSHLVGVKETTDEQTKPSEMQSSGVPGATPPSGNKKRREGLAKSPGAACKGTAMLGQSGSIARSPSGPPSSTSGQSANSCVEEGGDVAAWFNVLSDWYQVERFTSGFEVFRRRRCSSCRRRSEGAGGPGPRDSDDLLRWIFAEDLDAFVQKVQVWFSERHLAGGVDGGGDGKLLHEEFFRFRPPSLHPAKLGYMASVSLSEAQGNMARIVFQNVRLIHWPPRGEARVASI